MIRHEGMIRDVGQERWGDEQQARGMTREGARGEWEMRKEETSCEEQGKTRLERRSEEGRGDDKEDKKEDMTREERRREERRRERG